MSIGAGPLDIPDNLTIPQFFDASHVSRPAFPDDSPCLIEEQTGRTLSFADVSTCTLSSDPPHLISVNQLRSQSVRLANAIHLKWNTGTSSHPPRVCFPPLVSSAGSIIRSNPDTIPGERDVGEFSLAHTAPHAVRVRPSLTLLPSSCFDQPKSHRFHRRDVGCVAPRRYRVVRAHLYTQFPSNLAALKNQF